MEGIGPIAVRVDTVLAEVQFYNNEGDSHYRIVFKVKEVGKGADKVGHPDHVKLLDRVANYFHLTRPIDYRGAWNHEVGVQPKYTNDANHPVIYTPVTSVYTKPVNVWTIRLFTHKAKVNGRDNPVWAYQEDNGEIYEFVSEARRNLMAVAAATKATPAGKPKAEKVEKVPRGPVVKSIADLPLASKPTKFVLGGTEYDVKVFGKTHRDMRNPDGPGRIEDPNTPRTATDDVFTYKATAYQLGKVSKVFWGKNALFIVAANGLGILQTIRKGDKEQVAILEAAITEKGSFKGTFETL